MGEGRTAERVVTDTLGVLIVVCLMAASIQDRDGAKTALLSMFHTVGVRFVLTDGGFAGALVDWCHRILATTLEIVRKPAGPKGFALIPGRWLVERTFAWLTAHRRLAHDYEDDAGISQHVIRWARRSTACSAASPAAGQPFAKPAESSTRSTHTDPNTHSQT